MATVSFLWHLHQPAYRTADQRSHAPWAALHAGGAYTTLARAINDVGGRGQVVNIVPTLLEQLGAYVDDAVTDPVLDSLLTPVGDLEPQQRETLVEWAFHVNPRQLNRYPRLAELKTLRLESGNSGDLAGGFEAEDLRDLQILFTLAQAGEQAWTDQRLVPAFERGRDFTADHHHEVAAWLRAQPGELIDLWRRIATLDGVEIATSPFAHPIMPLLIDSGIVSESWAPKPAPEVPAFAYPDDARWQLDRGLTFMREHGFETTGCWPPEGSVSADALEIYSEAGVGWLATDEGILERSLDRPLREGELPAPELYRAWKLTGDGPALFFRDRHLSDAIGFQYGNWDDEGKAAESFVGELERLAQGLSDDACVTIALDGENPWLYYPDGGGRFLSEMMTRVAEAGPHLRPATLEQVAASTVADELPRLHPGSWINSVFATWIGHPEKTRAWGALTSVRDAIADAGADRPQSLLLAEGSDWFWWLGDDNPTDLAPLYDQIFRHHLADACDQAGITPPLDLDQPLKGLPGADPESSSVSEFRFCPIKHRWTIIAPERNNSPAETATESSVADGGTDSDPFAPGNETLTPPAILTFPPGDDSSPWQVRVFPNSVPVLRVEGDVVKEAIGLNDTVSGVGAHEVIVETPDPHLEMADLELEQIVLVLQAYRSRLADLRHDSRLRYSLIFKNKGRDAGASQEHAHSQLIATPIIPTAVVDELKAAREHFERRERCLFCDLIRQELRLAERICIENRDFLAVAPFAAASPYETWILPKDHLHDFTLATDAQLRGFAEILRDLLRRMRIVLDDPPYNFVLHTAPNPHPRPGRPDFWSTIQHDFHWHLEFVPRTRRTAGFELGSGYSINSTPPEEAARQIREAEPDQE
jgi:UDPglucose--hexose-1-phosphate uridylyltransferase